MTTDEIMQRVDDLLTAAARSTIPRGLQIQVDRLREARPAIKAALDDRDALDQMAVEAYAIFGQCGDRLERKVRDGR